MKYKHGFLALLGGCVLTVASVANADPGGAAGAAGSAGGTAGTAGTAGKAGAAGSAAGAAGTGTGVAGQPGAAVTDIGKACAADADCGKGAGKCLTASGKALFDGGPANGYCTVDCTDWLKAVDELDKNTAGSAGAPPAPLPYPCQPNANINDPADNAKIQNFCLNFGSDTETVGYCVQLCDFGTPEFGFDGKLDATKCRGRNDVGCYPSTNQDTGVLSISFCRPACQDDSQCGKGTYCDRIGGVCVAGARPAKKKNGESCTVPDANATESPCEGYCARLYSATDPKTPAGKENAGICIDPCIADDIEQSTASSCGGIANGLCLLGLFNPLETAGDDDSSIAFGKNDYAGCIKAADSDDGCDYGDGWLIHDYSGQGNLNFCVPATECETTADCAYSCKADADCGTSSTCNTKTGKCELDGGEPNSGNNLCSPVALLGCKKYCVDHETDASGKCGGGTGGAGGAGGKPGTGGSNSAGGEGTTGGKAGTTTGTGGKAGSSTTPTAGSGGTGTVGLGGGAGTAADSGDSGGCSLPVGGSNGSSSAALVGLGLLGALVSRRRRQG